MKTKLVYVLTCAPEATYIEQALMAVWSARYWNPDAHIVLMVDDKTDALLTGKRGEILNYISEKIVVPFENDKLTPMYRSRWIKTQVRQMIEGDFLFVDSDTICQRPLGDIDDFDCEVGAVLESHLKVKDYCLGLYNSTKQETATIGIDLDKEQQYYSSGVIFVKDTKRTHQLYKLWHLYWKDGNAIGLKIDQPSLAKANREVGYVIHQIPDSYNCILFTRPVFLREAHILHIASYQNPSFLFTKQVLNYVKVNGMENEWLQKMILNPCATIMPFDYNIKHSTSKDRWKWSKELAESWKRYGREIDAEYTDLTPYMQLSKRDVRFIIKGYPLFAIWMHITERWARLKRKDVPINYCMKG